MAAEDEEIVSYIFTGEEQRHEYHGLFGEYDIPWRANRLLFQESITVIPVEAFRDSYITEVICHNGVKKIEYKAFYGSCLERLVIPGVEVVGAEAIRGCRVKYVECPKLEIVGGCAFYECNDLSNINLPSAKDVRGCAFGDCEALREVKFGKKLESMHDGAFCFCPSLERITIPLKNGLFAHDNIFQGCDNLKRVDLVEEDAVRETIDALYLEEWKIYMNREMDSINQILPTARAGKFKMPKQDDGEKARVIRRWIERVLSTIIDYKVKHRRLMNGAASRLQLSLPNDVVMNYIIPFLELPSYTFEGEGEEEEKNSDDSDDSSYEMHSTSEEDEDEEVDDGEDGVEDDGSCDASLVEGNHEGEDEEEEADEVEQDGKRRKTGNEEYVPT